MILFSLGYQMKPTFQVESAAVVTAVHGTENRTEDIFIQARQFGSCQRYLAATEITCTKATRTCSAWNSMEEIQGLALERVGFNRRDAAVTDVNFSRCERSGKRAGG